MSFLSFAFLAALPLTAAPILLHLLDRRRNVVIEWGAMQFLVEAASQQTSARQLKQWLLLLLRVCAVAALVLALSRPMLPGSWFGNTDRGETVFIIDNSMSMQRTLDDSTLFDAAVERAAAELDEISTGDYVRALLASPYPVWATTGSLRVDDVSRDVIADQLREVRPTSGRSDLLAALFEAVQADVQPTQRQRRIVLLTDGQSTDWSIDDNEGWTRFQTALASAAVPTQLEIVGLDDVIPSQSNVAIDDLHSTRQVVGIDQPFEVAARITNFGQQHSSPCTALWTVGEHALHEGSVPGLNQNESHEVVWSHSFSEEGVYAIHCRIDADDALAPDNESTIVVEVVQEVPVTIVEGAGELAEMQQDAFFVQAALGWIDGEALDSRGVHVPTLVDPGRLAHLDLSEQRAVVIPNYTGLDEATVQQLRDFVADGGGLWIALGPRTDVEAFNQLFYAEGSGLVPLAIDRIVDESTSSVEVEGEELARQKPSISPYLPAHPATTALADSEKLDLGDVTVSRRFRFFSPAEGEDVSVLLSLTNGDPLTVENYYGRGRVIVQAIPLRLQWSELARSQAMVVMVQDWLDYLTQPLATRHNLSPGDPISVPFADASTKTATLKTPHGDEIDLTADVAGEGVMFRSSRTILPGDYWLELGLSGDRIPFHVKRSSEESDMTPLTADSRELLAGVVRQRPSTSDTSKDAASLNAASHHEPLWPILLIGLIGVIAAELLLSGLIARERFGSDPIAETADRWSARAEATPLTFSTKPEVATAGSKNSTTGRATNTVR